MLSVACNTSVLPPTNSFGSEGVVLTTLLAGFKLISLGLPIPGLMLLELINLLIICCLMLVLFPLGCCF